MSGYTRIENSLIDWLINQDISARKMKLVLFVLRYTVCFHREYAELSLSYIEKATGILRNNVQSDIKSLVEMNILRERFEGQKRFLSLGTVLNIDTTEEEAVLEIDNSTVLNSDNSTVLNFDNKEIKSIKLKELNNNDQTLFDRFWSCYPRKVSKPQAKKAFNTAMKKTDIETLILGLEHYKDHLQKTKTDEKFIKHPSTWLNAESWNDYKPASPIQPEQSSILRIVQNQSSMEDDLDREFIRKLYREREAKKDINCNRTARKLI